MQVTGTITKILPTTTGTSAQGKEWQKLSFVLDTKEEYNNILCFEIFGSEKVENFTKFNKVGQEVEVSFDIRTNEWQDKYFTSLNAWKVFAAKKDAAPAATTNQEPTADGLPF